jgi:hypothetical protein
VPRDGSMPQTEGNSSQEPQLSQQQALAMNTTNLQTNKQSIREQITAAQMSRQNMLYITQH